MAAERQWEREYAPAADGYLPPDVDPGNTGWNEPGAGETMACTVDDLERLSDLKAQYILEAYYRAVRDGLAEEHPAYLLPPPVGTAP